MKTLFAGLAAIAFAFRLFAATTDDAHAYLDTFASNWISAVEITSAQTKEAKRMLNVLYETEGGKSDIEDWYNVILRPIATNDLELATARLDRLQEATGMFVAGVALEFSTNLWYSCAKLHGDLKIKKLNKCEYMPIVTNQMMTIGRGRTRSAPNECKAMHDYQKKRSKGEILMERIIKCIADSEALASFPVQERNAIVSNIVELARLTADEAAELGLTNVVQTAGE